ncbi:MAG: hypothetical protein ACYTFI_00875 [Planctomycetota bacterium]|jgi:hypothetical protein
MKVVINKCFGGFGVSRACFLELHKRGAGIIEKLPFSEACGGKTWPSGDYVEAPEEGWYMDKSYAKFNLPPIDHGVFAPSGADAVWCSLRGHDDEHRTDPDLIALIEEHGPEWASGTHAALKIVSVPDDVEWTVEEYDGQEHIAQVHETWG